MIVDKEYCMSSFLMFRTIVGDNIAFTENLKPKKFQPKKDRYKIRSIDDIDKAIKQIFKNSIDKKTGIMLSGGIDSAILAKYMPEGTKAYTLKCIAEGAIDETERARKYVKENSLVHRIVEIYWEDYIKLSPKLMKHKGAPIHSIEPQIYKAALQAKEDGLEKLIFGEAADAVFGGLDGLLSKEWKFEEFVDRYTFVKPERVLKRPRLILDPYKKFQVGNIVDTYRFLSEFFYLESVGSYTNACSLAGVEFIAPYVDMKLDIPIDLHRIRMGESKYLIRELFEKLYPGFEIVKKIPMPRAMNQWLANWKGPKREEFIQNSIDDFKGDQKWLVYALELFLDLLDKWEKEN